jgi:hypothetical protein
VILTQDLAEFAGIHAGDGHLRKDGRGLELSGGYDEKEYYDEIIIPILEKLINRKIKGRIFPSKGTYGINLNHKFINNLLEEFGFPKGNKSKVVEIPSIILNSNEDIFKRAFLRGLFDTDGSLSFDRKSRNTNPLKKKYHFYPRILLTTISRKMAEQVKKLCFQEGLNCSMYGSIPKIKTESTKYKLQILGKSALDYWMEHIGFNNPSKRSRFEIWAKFGFCPPNTTYEQRRKILKGELNPY